jgi:hypothetical protein
MIDKTKLERQARATARRAGKVLHKCDDDRFLIVCPRTHHITPCKGMLTLREVLDWFDAIVPVVEALAAPHRLSRRMMPRAGYVDNHRALMHFGPGANNQSKSSSGQEIMGERTDDKRENEPKQGSHAPWQRPALVRLKTNKAKAGGTTPRPDGKFDHS